MQQMRSSKVHGLAAADEATPTALRRALLCGATIASLILGAAAFFCTQTTSSDTPRAHVAGAKLSAAPVVAASLPAQVVAPQAFAQVTPDEALAINASIPFSLEPIPAAKPFKLAATDPALQATAQTCLTMAVYYEAANQGVVGEAAVAQVVLNRLRSPIFPKSVCGVVFQGSQLPTGCQFTFTCDGSLNRRPDPAGWKQASEIAERALNGYVEPSVGEATHFHTVWVVPYWEFSVVKVAQIGAHIFYRMDGALGLPGAFVGRYAGVEAPPLNLGNRIALAGPAPSDDVSTAPILVAQVTAEKELPTTAVPAEPSVGPTLAPAIPKLAPPKPPLPSPVTDLALRQRLAMPSNW